MGRETVAQRGEGTGENLHRVGNPCPLALPMGVPWVGVGTTGQGHRAVPESRRPPRSPALNEAQVERLACGHCHRAFRPPLAQSTRVWPHPPPGP